MKVGVTGGAGYVGPLLARATKEFSYNLEKIRKGLGYEPSWSVQAGIDQIIMYRLGQLES
jgi:nucleoside-diphosphate-sugar epimerase